MPACAAHYQFGQDVLSRLDADLKSCALACKREYDIGLQGPDIFLFYKPYRKTGISDYGTRRHDQPAIRMFTPILVQRREGSVLSYLMGLICHYTLDKFCHPYVYEHSRRPFDHQRMESSFDRHIMSFYGLTKARYLYLPISGLDYKAMASLWPGITAGTIKKCVKAERRYTRLLDHKWILNALETAAKKPGEFTPMSLPDSVSGIQAEHVRHLNALYQKALGECPGMIRRAVDLMGTKLTGGQGFDLNYKGYAAGEQAGKKLDTP